MYLSFENSLEVAYVSVNAAKSFWTPKEPCLEHPALLTYFFYQQYASFNVDTVDYITRT